MQVMTTRHETSIQSVKTSRPKYHRNDSHRSSSASHEFNSDYASEVSSGSATGYETPPSRISTPRLQHNNDTEMTLPQRPTTALPAPLSIRTVERHASQQQRGPVEIPRNLDNMSPPTPGVDDTPYIRFAIEQLSFDEELRGRGRYSVFPETIPSPQVVPVQQLQPTERIAPQLPQPSIEPTHPQRPVVERVRSQPQSFMFPPSSFDRPRTQKQEFLVPVEPPDGSQWSELGYIPLPLRLSTISLLVLSCLLMIAGIIFSNVHASRSHGLYDYDGNTTPRYFVFQYLPQMLGMAIIFWLFVIQAAIYRTLPYLSMSLERSQDRALKDIPIVSSSFLLPDLRFFTLGEPLIGIVLLIFWLTNWTVPTLACLYQTQYYLDVSPPRWRWSSVEGIGWFLVAIYLLLILALFCCILKFRTRKSALVWDPRSLADIIVIFQRSNILNDFSMSEVAGDLTSFIPSQLLRLGYWTTSNSSEIYHAVGQRNRPLNRLSLQEPPIQDPQMHRPSHSSDSFDIERHRYSHDSGFTRDIHSPFIRHRWCPWYLRDGAVLAWVIGAILLLIAFLVVSFVNRAVQNGFYPLLPSSTQSNGFSPSNFLYSFLPTLLGMFLFLAWQPIDVFYRTVQPFANLTSASGTTAKKSILQSYTASLPLFVVMESLANGDLKLAFVTFVSILSSAIPILAGGVFTAQLFDDDLVRIVASMPGYIALCVVASIYAFGFLFIWPTRKRYLPHSINTIAGQLSFLYASPLLNDPGIRNVKSKADLIARLSGHVSTISPSNGKFDEKMGLTGDGRRNIRERHIGKGNKWIDRQLKYAFGIYIGRDGKEHLGIDRLQRPGSGEMLVVTGTRRSLASRAR